MTDHERHRRAMEDAEIPPNARRYAQRLIGIAFVCGLSIGAISGAIVTAIAVLVF